MQSQISCWSWKSQNNEHDSRSLGRHLGRCHDPLCILQPNAILWTPIRPLFRLKTTTSTLPLSKPRMISWTTTCMRIVHKLEWTLSRTEITVCVSWPLQNFVWYDKAFLTWRNRHTPHTQYFGHGLGISWHCPTDGWGVELLRTVGLATWRTRHARNHDPASGRRRGHGGSHSHPKMCFIGRPPWKSMWP